MPLAAQLAKLLTKGAQKAMSPVMKHEPTMRVLTPEQEAASFAPIGPSSYRLLPEEQAPITSVETPIAEMEELVPPAESNKPRIRRQVEDLGLSEKEVDELLIPEPIDISNMPEAWKAPYMKARDQEFTVPLYHFTRAGEEIQIDPRGEGTGFLDPLLLKKAGNDTRDIGTHLGTLSAMGKMNKRLGKKKRKIMGVTLGQKQGEEQLGQAMLPVVTKLNNVAIVPDMGRFKLPSEWLENLSNLNIEIRPTKTIKHLLRKDNLEKDFKGNIDTIKSTLDSSIETVNDLKRYVKEKGDFIFWPEDGNFIYLKNEEKLSTLDNFGVKLSKTKASKFIDFSKSFDPLKGMSPTLWKQLMEAAHALHMKNIKLTTKKMDPDAGVFIPENIHPSLIDDWYKALRKILEEGGYDAFAYPNFTEDYGAFSYMFLDPKKVKSIFAREFDKENVSFGKNEGGVVDMRNGGKVGAAVVAASLMASGGQAMDMRNGGVVGMKKGGSTDKMTPAYVRSFLSDIFTNTKGEVRDASYFSKGEQDALLQVARNARKRTGNNEGEINYKEDYPKGFQGIFYGSSADTLTSDPFKSIKRTLGNFSWKYDNKAGQYLISDKYNFNDAAKINKENPEFLDKALSYIKETGEGVSSGRLGLYGIARTTGKYFGSEEGEGAKFIIKLSDKKDI